MKHQHAPVGMEDLLGRDLNTKPVDQAGDGSARLRERGGADDPPGPSVGHAEYDLATALIGQCGAVLCQRLEVKVRLGFLELQPLCFRCGEPGIKLI
jgi:hypothetical protein